MKKIKLLICLSLFVVMNSALLSQSESHNWLPERTQAIFFWESGYDLVYYLSVYDPPKSQQYASDEEILKNLPPGSRNLYVWSNLYSQVFNGGFVQYYYNGYGKQMPLVIKGMELIGDTSMYEITKTAHDLFLKDKAKIAEARENGEFGDFLYESMNSLSSLDSKFYKLAPRTHLLFEKYARQNPNDFFKIENEKPFQMTFSGTHNTLYKTGVLKEEIELKDGIINGFYKSYFPSGKIHTMNNFENGIRKGEQVKWNEFGKMEIYHFVQPEKNQRIEKAFYESGVLKTEFIRDYIKDKTIGIWRKYHPNGKKMAESGFTKDSIQVMNYWNEAGEQLMKNGNGLFIHEFESAIGDKINLWRNEGEYKDFKRNGWSQSYINDILQHESMYASGIQHGVSRRYENGVLATEEIYENGKIIE